MKAWLNCVISDGMFSTECAATINSGLSLFAPSEYFRHNGYGQILVDVVERSNNQCLVMLPRTTLERGQYVTVPVSDLEFIQGAL